MDILEERKKATRGIIRNDMRSIKIFIKRYFQHFSYFYSILKYKIFVFVFVNLSVGVLDGLGLAMFLPLLEIADGHSEIKADQLGSLSFIIKALNRMDIHLTLTSVLIVMLIFFAVKGIAKFIEVYIRVMYQQYFMRKIRISNIDLLSNFNYNHFVNADSGRIQNSFSGEVERVNNAFRDYFFAIQCGVSVIVYVVLAFLANPNFAFLVAIGGVLTNLVFKKLYNLTKTISRKLAFSYDGFQGLLIQNVAYFKYLKATGSIFQYANKLKKSIIEMDSLQRKVGILSATLQAIREPLIISIVLVVILLQVKVFDVKFSLIILSLLFLYRSLTFLMAMQNFWNLFLASSGSLDNLNAFTNELKYGQEDRGKREFNNFQNNVSFNNISFYFENTSILQNINFQIRRNETVAIVGESGSGKTTLMNILTGLLKPKAGDITVDGIDLQELDIRTFQKRIGYITQEPVIFNDSIFNNVTFWDDHNAVSKKRFDDAIRKASLYDFIMDLTQKEDTLLGHNGINISGGQKQRISIARELYKEADFLLMDEATSSLDTETEIAIQENIDQLKGKLTILIIAHRLSTVKNADKIIILNKGQIEEIGSFKELSDSSNLFRRMVKLQEF